MAKRKYVKENNLVKAINTDSLELQKPLVNEYYDINVHNSNMDKIDKGYKQNKNDISSINSELSKTKNTKYATTNGIKEFSCKDGYVDNIVIEGKTLVNCKIPGTCIWDGNENRLKNVHMQHTLLKANTTYTLFNLSSKEIDINLLTLPSTWENSIVCGAKSSTTFVVGANQQLGVMSGWGVRGWSSTMVNEFNNSIVILEGDHTDKHISYFEGLKSVGQGDKIEVLIHSEVSNTTTILETNCTQSSYMNANGEVQSDGTNWCVTDFIEIRDNYIDFGEYNKPIDYWSTCFYDENKKFISNLRGGIGSSFNNIKPKNAKFLRTSIKSGFASTQIRFCNKVDKKTISTTLRSLPNGVKDTIEKRGNKYVKVQRCGEHTINGNSIIQDMGHIQLEKTIRYGVKLDVNLNGKPTYPICVGDTIPFEINYSGDYKHFYIDNANNQSILYVFMLKTELTSITLEKLKELFNKTPLTVVYELATPIIEELPNFNPQIFSDKTTLLLNSGVVQAEASFEVTNSLGSELEVLKGKISDLDDSISDRPITKYELTPLNGWTKFYGSSYITRSGDVFNINIGIQGGTTTSGTILFHINNPSFIPKNNQVIFAGDDVTGGKIYELVVRTNGTITVGSKCTFVNKMFITGSYNLE